MSLLICLDAGHGIGNRRSGKYDPGAVYTEDSTGSVYCEADIVLFYSEVLEHLLKLSNYRVFQTRSFSSGDVSLSSRTAMAKDAGCDALISLHMNAFSNPRVSGCEVLYKEEKGAKLATTLLAGVINSGLKIRSRGIKKRNNLAILNYSKPVALLELGFITNESDRSKSCDLVKAKQVCSSIVTHINMLGF